MLRYFGRTTYYGEVLLWRFGYFIGIRYNLESIAKQRDISLLNHQGYLLSMGSSGQDEPYELRPEARNQAL